MAEMYCAPRSTVDLLSLLHLLVDMRPPGNKVEHDKLDKLTFCLPGNFACFFVVC